MNIKKVEFSSALEERYLAYALSTITHRALPDVRDGLKPVHRRLLYAMYQLRLGNNSGFKKSARVVGDVIGKFHPHGDQSVYEALVRLAQAFSTRYQLIDGQGNFGNIDGDNAAAMRYTEARLTAFAELMLRDITEETVDFIKTYDGSEEEPMVLPSAFPNLLANGASGIAVGMATNIPPHNVEELFTALLKLQTHPNNTQTQSKEGIMFDGSSIAGWKDINESDMILMPDPSTAIMDPFTAQPQLILFCFFIEPSDGKPYELDPRSTGKKAEEYLKKSGVGDSCFFGPEAEFFIFDDVKWSTSQEYTFYSIDSEEGAYNTGSEMEGGNMGHRPKDKGGYFPVPPVDSATDIRAEMVSTMEEMGIDMEKHHHEVAPSQHELGLKFGSLIDSADNLQKYKYCVHMVAQAYGKTATFMPKPVYNDNGSGMHVHQSIWKAKKSLFAGSGYSGLSDSCLMMPPM
jgi:hypothetical protein